MKRSFLFETVMISAFAIGQFTGAEPNWFSSSKSVHGVVEQVHSNRIKVYDKTQTNTGLPDKVNVNVNADTIYKDVSSIAELKKGDKIQIKYKEENEGTKVAMEIAKLRPAYDANKSLTP
jgi:hypothetical protein